MVFALLLLLGCRSGTAFEYGELASFVRRHGGRVHRSLALADPAPCGSRGLVAAQPIPETDARTGPLVVVPAAPADRATKPYVVVGHCCESGDLLTPAPDEPETLAPRELTEAARGDLLVVEGCGAYCAAMSTAGYNSFPTAPEVMKDAAGAFHLVRKRSTLEQLLSNEVAYDP